MSVESKPQSPRVEALLIATKQVRDAAHTYDSRDPSDISLDNLLEMTDKQLRDFQQIAVELDAVANELELRAFRILRRERRPRRGRRAKR